MSKAKINTMEELSLAIGVSRPTLSRWFQNPASVRASTAEKITLGLATVDYVPNFFATRLNRKSTGLIGVIIPDLNDLFFTSLLEVIERAAMAEDFTVISQSSHGDPAIEAHAVEKLISMNADGVIVAPLGEHSSASALERLAAHLPLVFVDSRLPEAMPQIDFVGTDNRQSIALVVDHLCRTGPGAPAFLGMPRLNSNATEREAAYLSAMAAQRLTPTLIAHDSAIPETWAFEAYGHVVMDDHFSRGRFRTATILCANDRLAIGAIRAAHRHRLLTRGAGETPPGERLRIAGHDDHPLSRYMFPAITTVAQDIGAIGAQAVRVLAGRIGRDGPESSAGPAGAGLVSTFEARLKLRESA